MTTAPWLFDTIDATWPAAEVQRMGPWTLRRGAGGGQRVSAATADGPFDDADIDRAEAAMRDWAQRPIFMIRPEDTALDDALQRRGYALHDPVAAYACPVGQLCDLPLPRVTVFSIWPPLEIMRELWAEGGIGPARLAVMDRAAGPKTGLLARRKDQPAGAAFVAMNGAIAMVHALEITPAHRRQGMGVWMMRAAALWARDQGATELSVICTRANAGANALYSSLGMQPVGQYHYRLSAPEDPRP